MDEGRGMAHASPNRRKMEKKKLTQSIPGTASPIDSTMGIGTGCSCQIPGAMGGGTCAIGHGAIGGCSCMYGW